MCVFNHFSQVVLGTILLDSEEKRKFHLKLADYFEHHCKDEDRVIFMTPEQLKLAGERKRLIEFLRNDARSKNKPGFWKNSYYKVIMLKLGDFLLNLKSILSVISTA